MPKSNGNAQPREWKSGCLVNFDHPQYRLDCPSSVAFDTISVILGEFDGQEEIQGEPAF
jgi:hypothetical protein